MHIILEGADNSGKSTLAKYLSSRLDLPINAGEGPERYPGEINERIVRYNALTRMMIFDRHSCISHQIYGTLLYFKPAIPDHIIDDFYAQGHLFIYCVDRGLEGHVERPEVDTDEHLSLVHIHQHTINDWYRSWAIARAHIIYRVGDSMERVYEMVEGAIAHGA